MLAYPAIIVMTQWVQEGASESGNSNTSLRIWATVPPMYAVSAAFVKLR